MLSLATLTAFQQGPEASHARVAVAVDQPASPASDELAERFRSAQTSFHVAGAGGDAGWDVSAALYLPGEGASSSRGLVVLTPGFLVRSAAYASYLEALLAQGVAACTWDVTDQSPTHAMDDVDSVRALHRVMSWAAEQQQQQAKAGPPAVSQGTPQVVLVGHSRGGKLSVLAALPQPADPSPPSDGVAGPAPPRPAVQVAGLVLLDPADASFERMDAARFPSALAALQALGPSPTLPPTLIVGAGRNKDCVPTRASYRAFHDVLSRCCPGGRGSVLLELADAGHFAFLDVQSTLQQAVCSAGRTPSEAVRAVARHAVVEWAQLVSSPALDAASATDRLAQTASQLGLAARIADTRASCSACPG